MTKRKKKNQTTLIILLLALVLLSGFYIWFLNRDKFNPSEPDDMNIESDINSGPIIATMDIDLVDRIHFKNENADMILINKDGSWLLESDRKRPIKQNYVQNMVNILEEIKATRLVNEKPEDLKDYGLLDPYASIEASQSDGKRISLSIGNKVPGGQGYYAKLEGNDAVYILPMVYGSNFSYSDVNMTQIDRGPSITSNNIYHIEVLQKDGQDFELRHDPDSQYYDSESSLLSWFILKPYDKPYAADSSKVYELLDNYSSFNFLNCVEYETDDFEKYGLEDPRATILVEYYEEHIEVLDEPDKDPDTGEEIGSKTITEEKSFKLLLGDIDNSGDYYVRKDGDKAVYTMKASNVEAMLRVDAFDVLSTFVNLHDISSVERLDIDIEGISYTMEIKRKEDTETYYFNGEITTENAFKDLYQEIISAKIDVQLKEEVSIVDQAPILTISYYIKGKDEPYTSKYFSYDDSFYIIEKDNHIQFAADKRKIDSIIESIKGYRLNEE
jgi:hypothetical protein